MSFLLDTCVISEFKKAKPAQGVVKWIDQIPEEEMYLSVLTIGEIYNGIAQLRHGKKRQEIISWVEQLMISFGERLLPVELAVTKLWGEESGRLRGEGKPLTIIDGLLAATAITRGLTLVTRNVKDIAHTHVEYINPWE